MRPIAPPKVGHYCGHCGQGFHRHCYGPCSCADTGHRPGDELAAAMRLYQSPDLLGDTVERLADEYRRKQQ